MSVIPTKTSGFVIQSSSREGSLSRRAACQVFCTSFLVIGFRLYIVAIWQSRLMHWSILLHHLDFIVLVEWLRPWMVRSQRRTQIRCADSDISIRRRRDGPLLIMFSSSWCRRAMLPQPRIRPSWMSGHRPNEFGHVCFASLQMVEIAMFSQSIRMCSRDSGDLLQLAQCALLARWGISFQNLPIRNAPWSAL